MTGYKVNIFVPEGDPEGIRIIDKMNWTGVAVRFPRLKWAEVKKRSEFSNPGIYILVGHVDTGESYDGLPTIYIGQGEEVRTRIESHYQNKDFWEWGVVFSSTANRLNRAHITWLEYALVKRANEVARSHLENGNTPQEPNLAEADKADMQVFLAEILQILPFAELRAFEAHKAIVTVNNHVQPSGNPKDGVDTIIVPAKKDGFDEVFINENRWYALRIAGGKLDKIKYIAAYQGAPISAVTHYAPVKNIELFGDTGKYLINFAESAKVISPIPFGNLPAGGMQSPRYTNLQKLLKAETLDKAF